VLKWELDLWGRIRRSIEAAQAQLLSRGENQRTVILELVSAVSQAYFDLRQLDLQVDITKRTLTSWNETVTIRKSSWSTGSSPSSISTGSKRSAPAPPRN
jgi:outer membrane protein, multidrug efflux system